MVCNDEGVCHDEELAQLYPTGSGAISGLQTAALAITAILTLNAF